MDMLAKQGQPLISSVADKNDGAVSASI